MPNRYTEEGVIDFVLHIPSNDNPYLATADLLTQALRVSEAFLGIPSSVLAALCQASTSCMRNKN